jgi:MFS family permease
LPWELTGDPLALGMVLALGGIPRAVFLLVGGAITDRLAARRVMLISDIARLALTATMATVVLLGLAQMRMLYCFASVCGLVSGMAIPAENSIVPTLPSPSRRTYGLLL